MGNLLSCERRASRSSASLLDADDVALWWGRLQDPGVGGADTSRTHRAKRHQDIMQRGGFELGMAEAITFLEQNAVLGKTKDLYRLFTAIFLSFCDVMLLPLDGAAQVDSALVQFMQMAFECGEDISYGQTTLAAFCDAYVEYGKGGPLFSHLPRTRRALRAWRRIDPPASRLPYGWTIVAGLCVLARLLFGEAEAVCMASHFDVYARPQAWLAVRWGDVTDEMPGLPFIAVTMCPRELGKASKTGKYDDTVLVGEGVRGRQSNRIAILRVLANYCRRHRGHPEARVFPFEYPHYLHVWKTAGELLGLEGKGECTPYQGRHGGASQDAADGAEMVHIQRRGGWAQIESVRRYEKRGRLQEMLGRLSEQQRRFCYECESRFEEFMEHPHRAPALPH